MSFSVFSSKEGEYQFPEFLIGHHEICGSGQNVKCLQLDFYKNMAGTAHDNLHITQSFVPITPSYQEDEYTRGQRARPPPARKLDKFKEDITLV